jgi:hypothetical protein
MSTGLYSGTSGLALGVGLYAGNPGLWGGAAGFDAGLQASLYLNFLAGAPLDPRITFTRGSNATLVDSTGKLTYAPANLVLRSQEFDSASWNKTVGTFGGTIPVVTPNVAEAPDGTMTADRAQFATGGTTNSDDLSTLVQIPAGAGTPALFSVWVKSNTTSDQVLLLRVGSTFTAITATPSWQRFSALQSTPVTSYAVNIGLRGSVTGTVSSADVLLWGAQLEPVTYQTTAGPYVATTTAAYYGPRFDYDPVTLAAKGLLIEEQRTNLVTYSEQFNNAAWSKSSVTVTADTTVAPDGTTTADTLTTSTIGGFTWQVVGFTGDGDKVFSCFVKAGTAATSVVQIRDATVTANRGYFIITWTAGVPSVARLTTGTVLGVDAFGNGWYRLRLLATGVVAANSNQYRFLPDTTSGTGTVIAWGAQAENGAFATSYIPTVASQVTRSADVATMTGTNFSSWYNQSAGTFVVGADRIGFSSSDMLFAATDSGSTNLLQQTAPSATSSRFNVRVGGVDQAILNTTVSASAVDKIASAYAENDFASVVNGGTLVTDTSGTIPTVDRLGIGSRLASIFYNGHIRQIAFYNTRLSNATLQALTA